MSSALSPRASASSISRLQRGDLFGVRAVERRAPRQRVAHRAADREIGGRARRRITRATQTFRLHRGEAPPLEARQFEILEKEVEEFVGRQDDAELVLAAALPRLRPGAARSAAAGRARDPVAFKEVLVARKHVLAQPRRAAAKTRFVYAGRGHDDGPALFQLPDGAAG